MMARETQPSTEGWADLPADPGVTLRRLAGQIDYFDHRARRDQLFYRWMKGVILVAAGAIATAAVLQVPSWVPGVLGAAIMVIEAFLVMNAYHENWLRYRKTAEELKREKYLFIAGAGAYDADPGAEKLLAARVEEILAGERERWVGVARKQPQVADEAAIESQE